MTTPGTHVSSSLLVMTAGSTVVTWDCHRQQQQQQSDEQDNNALLFRTFQPFGQTADAPNISAAWNHNGQVLACCSSLPTNTTTTTTTTHSNATSNTSGSNSKGHNIVLMSTQSGSSLDSFCHNDPNSANAAANTGASIGSLNSVGSTIAANNNSTQTNTNTISSTTAAATCVAFGGKSRYLCIGDDHGGVCLWDLKKHSRVRQFLSKSVSSTSSKATAHSHRLAGSSAKSLPIRQACLDPTATYVCALSSQHWTLYHLRQATLASQWLSTCYSSSSSNDNNNGWQQFRFSPLQPNVFALGDSAGRIQLHSTLEHECPVLVCGGPSAAPSTAFPHHTSPVTGLAFSTQNSKLLANCRANGILEFVDTSSGEVIHHQQTCSAPTKTVASTSTSNIATALAFQGVTCAVGNSRGECQVYDLRMMMQQFGKAVATFNMNQVAISFTAATMPITTLEFSPLIRPLGGAAGGTLLRSSNSFTSVNSMDLESKGSMSSVPPMPAAITGSSAPESQVGSTNSLSNNVTKPTIETNTKVVMDIPEEEGVEVAHTPVPPPPPPPRAETVSPPKSPRKNKHVNQQNQHNIAVATSTNKEASALEADVIRYDSTAHKTAVTSAIATRSRYLLQDDNEVGRMDTDNFDAGDPSRFNDELSAIIRHEIQYQFLALRDDTDESIRNLHVDMIRQFQRQSQELMQVVAKQEQRTSRILEENQLLREQNQELQRQLAGISHSIAPKMGGRNGFHH